MSKKPKTSTTNEFPAKGKKSYSKPEIKSEPLMAFGASCNGTSQGGRKSSAGAPDFCQSRKLLS